MVLVVARVATGALDLLQGMPARTLFGAGNGVAAELPARCLTFTCVQEHDGDQYER